MAGPATLKGSFVEPLDLSWFYKLAERRTLIQHRHLAVGLNTRDKPCSELQAVGRLESQLSRAVEHLVAGGTDAGDGR